MSRPRSWRRLLPVAVLAAVSYGPLLATQPGRVGSDTKTYLYLDPGRLLGDAPYLWDAGVGLGGVTHQVIGYLWPMGPWFWLFETLGVPDWVAQRLWTGTLLFAAGTGVLFLLRTFGWPRSTDTGDGRLPPLVDLGMFVAALAYATSPYLLAYVARLSVILLPWAGLPWLIALFARALRVGGWRYPALFALVVTTVGSTNLTSLVLVGLAPLLWVPFAVWGEDEVRPGAAAGAILRTGLLTAGASLWWFAGLVVAGAHAIPIVRYTETYQAVAVASTTPEVVRGLGYWFFYGNDKLGQWVLPSLHYMRAGIPISFAVPTLALVAGALTRFRHRLYFLTLIVVGAVVAVGGHPFDDPSPAGGLLVEWTRTDLGLAFRSTTRVLPLLVLGTAVLLGAGVVAIGRWRPRLGRPVGLVAVVLVLANLPALFTGELVDRTLQRDEEVPGHWQDAADHLDARRDGTRVLELPGADFAAYRWGNTVDPITPGLIDRPYVARELVPLGTPVSTNLVNAIDRPLQEGTFDPAALAPLARLLGAGDVVLRSDLEYERFRTPRPAPTWATFGEVPGLGPPVTFGEAVPNRARPELPLIDEAELATNPDLADPPPVAVFPVEEALPSTRSLPAEHPTLVAGDGDGLVAAAAEGLVDPRRAILYAAALVEDEALLEAAFEAGADVVVTDSNRRRARRWGAVRENEGYTETAGEIALVDDVTDNRLEVFPAAGDDSATVAVQRGGARVQASGYGNPITFTPGDRAVFALDGDPRTAWRVGAFDQVEGEFLRITTDEPRRADRIRLLQARKDDTNRWITEVALHFDDDEPVRVRLDRRSRRGVGQLVTFPERTFTRLDIEILGDTVGFRPNLGGVSAVGFAEVDLAGIRVEELIRPPVDVVRAAGDRLLDHRLNVVLTRLRALPSDTVRSDDEPALARLVPVGPDRRVAVEGEARISDATADEDLDELFGIPSAAEGGLTARSSARLPGDLSSRASSAVDGDPATVWSTPFDRLVGQHVELVLPEPVRVDHLDLQVVVDRRHSVPTRLRIEAGGEERVVRLPRIVSRPSPGAVRTVPVRFPAVRGERLRVTIDAVRPLETTNWYSNGPTTLPVAIAELGLDGVERPSPAERLDDRCRQDLLTIAGEPVPMRLDGTTAAAEAREPLALVACDDGVAVGGPTEVVAAPGTETAVDVDRLVLSSAAGGAAAAPALTAIGQPAPSVEVTNPERLTYRLETVAAVDEPFWFVVGESYGPGWVADVTGGEVVGHTVVSGYANGWLIRPAGDGPVVAEVRWPPQRLVWFGLAVSVLAVLACLALVVLDPGRRSRPTRGGDPGIVLAWPPRRESAPPASVRTTVVASALAAVGGTLLATPAVGAVLAVAAALGLRRPWGPLLVRLAPGVVVGAVACYVFVEQIRSDLPADFGWPKNFEEVHWVTMAAVLTIALDITVSVLRPQQGERR